MYSTKGQKAFLKYVVAKVESYILFQPTRDVHQDQRELKETHVLEVSHHSLPSQAILSSRTTEQKSLRTSLLFTSPV